MPLLVIWLACDREALGPAPAGSRDDPKTTPGAEWGCPYVSTETVGEQDCNGDPGVVLNEVSSANHATLVDVEGDTVDWVELYNAGAAPVALTGSSLSDDPDEPGKWPFPDLTLDPGAFLVVHASDKDRVRIVGRWETRIDQGHSWRYLPVRGAVDQGWYLPEYDDGGWDSGPSGFGDGDSDDATAVDAHTIYVRTELELTAAELADVAALVLHVDFDDAFAAYLNGVEVARYALGLPGSGPPAWDALATWPNEAKLYQGQRPIYFDLDAWTGLLREGSNTLALEVHDATPDSTDLTLVPFLTLGFASPGESRIAEVLGPLPTVDLHTNFALRAGERVGLFDAWGCEVDALDPEPLWADESYGRQPDGIGPLGYFVAPTPGAPNLTESRPGFAATPKLDPPPGYHAGGASITLTAGQDAEVRYAWAGREPTEEDPLYDKPLSTGDDGEAVVLRARAWQEGLWPSRIATGTYLLREAGTLPIVSVVTDPANLWDDEIGIYVVGSAGDPEYPHSGANFYQDWQRPAHVEQWEPDQTLGFAVGGSVAIHGGNSRRHDQKNLEITAGGGWGDAEAIEHQVFPQLEIDSFDRLVLRAGGGDWLGCWAEGCMGGTMSRDRLIHDLTIGVDLDRMAARPAVVYLNGEYWGLYFLNEKSDGAYVEDHHGHDDIDLLRNEATPRQGDEAAYLELLEWLRTHDLADPANLAHVETLVDVDELQNYLLFEIFFANRDWPGNNIEFWRPRAEDGRWRWLMFGTDLGLGADDASPEVDSLALALQADGDGWPNPPWSTELLRLLLQSPDFTDAFLNRYADLLNTLLLPERTQALNRAYADEIAAEIPRQIERWGQWTDGQVTYALEGGEWEQDVDHVEWWLGERPTHAREHVVAQFGLEGTWELTLDAEPPGSGTFELTAATVDGPFTGTYFRGVPVTITAHPAMGYAFAGWSDPNLPADPTVTVDPDGPLVLVARFQ